MIPSCKALLLSFAPTQEPYAIAMHESDRVSLSQTGENNCTSEESAARRKRSNQVHICTCSCGGKRLWCGHDLQRSAPAQCAVGSQTGGTSGGARRATGSSQLASHQEHRQQDGQIGPGAAARDWRGSLRSSPRRRAGRKGAEALPAQAGSDGIHPAESHGGLSEQLPRQSSGGNALPPRCQAAGCAFSFLCQYRRAAVSAPVGDASR